MTTNDEQQRAAFADYELQEMPNGAFVGEVYLLTHDVAAALGVEFARGCSQANERFMAAEKTIRDYVWRASQRAYRDALAHERGKGARGPWRRKLDENAFDAAWKQWLYNADTAQMDRDSALKGAISVYLASLPEPRAEKGESYLPGLAAHKYDCTILGGNCDCPSIGDVMATPQPASLDNCPGCNGPADNGHDRCYPPNLYYCTKCSDKPASHGAGEVERIAREIATFCQSLPDTSIGALVLFSHRQELARRIAASRPVVSEYEAVEIMLNNYGGFLSGKKLLAHQIRMRTAYRALVKAGIIAGADGGVK